MDDKFNIELVFESDSFTKSQKKQIQNARDRLQTIFTAKVPDFEVSPGDVVDDLRVLVKLETITDENGNPRPKVKAIAEIETRRPNNIPAIGSITFNSDSIGRLERQNNGIYFTALHETIHTLGFGFNWTSQYFNLLDNVFDDEKAERRYVGEHGLEAYKTMLSNTDFFNKDNLNVEEPETSPVD